MFDLFTSFLFAACIVALFILVAALCYKNRLFGAILLVVIIFVVALGLSGYARAEEVRVCHICGFALEYSCFVLEDEDGYLWLFDLEMDDYYLGDEYLLHLPDNGEPWYERVETLYPCKEVTTWFRAY